MGGYGFRRKGNDLGLHTPRMPPEVYQYIYKKVHAALRERFLIVASPIETPAKSHYGDLDVLVCWDTKGHFNECGSLHDVRKCLTPEELDSIKILIGATYALVERKQSTTAQLAIPWPETARFETVEESGPPLTQVDLHICRSLDDLEWLLFQYAHGDIFWFLHAMVRPLGLTLGVDGLQLRVEEIEDETRHHEILLSKDPTEVLRFFGLQPEGRVWEEPFRSCEALFEYASKCRFFCDFGDENVSEADRKRMKCECKFRA